MKRENIHILIIDDMDDMRMLLRSFLMDDGFTNVTEASDGKKGLSLIQNSVFHLVICDWNMPEMTGIELLEQVRSEERTEALPFLMVTGEANPERVKEAIVKKVNDFIIKPFQPEALTKKIVDVLTSSGRL
ncbi:MAG: response regulator [Pseudomonadales bacterium]|nr:response regulator [Pseudomonadales bacterium]